MTKEELVELGLNDEQIQGVFKINGLDIENVKVKVTELEGKLEIAEADKQTLEEDKRVLSEDLGAVTKSNDDITQLKADKIALAEEIEALKLSNQESLDNLTYTHLIDSLLKDAGAKNLDMAKSALNKEVVKLNEGKLEGAEEEVARLKTEFDFLFSDEKPGKPTFTKPASDTPPASSKDVFASAVNRIIGK